MDYGLHTDGELIDLIYAALLGESTWQAFLDRLSDHAPDGRTILFSHNMSQPDEYLAMTARFEGPELESYAAHYVDTNPWLEHCAVRSVGLAIHSDEIVSPEDLVRTEFYNDWLVPNGIARSIGMTIEKLGACPLILTTVTSRADPELNRQFSDQLTRIAPHLTRAARFYRNSSSRWAGFDLGVSLFDSVDVGVIVVGENERIRTISPVGQEQLDGGAPMWVSPLGQVRFRGEDAQAVLRDMLRRTYAGPKTVSLFSGGSKLTLVAVEKDRISQFFEGPTVAILIESSGGTFDPALFASTFRLTRAETRALRGIVARKSVDAIAAEADVSRETIRSQVKSLFLKTGVHSQNDLLRLVYKPPGD